MSVSDRGNLWATAPAAPAPNPYKLDMREFDLVRLLGRGLDLADIAELLGVTGRSVQLQRERIMLKLGARNLAHLEHIVSTLGRLDADWTETVYLDDFSDDGDDEPDLVFAD